jgi:crotonobetainyl-CoA hydratase
MSDGVEVVKHGAVMEITLNRPKANAIALSTSRRLNEVVCEFRDDPALRGMELVLGTDIIVMEEHARFALPEINVGVLADAGTIKLRRRIPYHVAVEFLLTGRWMDAAEAKHWGLANHVVPKGEGLKKAREIAAQLCEGPPLLFPAIKQLLRHTEMVPEHEAFALHDSLDAVQRVIRSDDLKEGALAFSEKRKPSWSGR